MSFKRRAIKRLRDDCNQSEGLIQATINACIRALEEIPDDEHSGEKTCGPNYEAECNVLRAKLEEMAAEKNEAEMMLPETRHLPSWVPPVSSWAGLHRRRICWRKTGIS